MNITVQGFEWELGAVGIDEFFKFVDQEYGNKQFSASQQKRIISVTKSGQYHCGLLVTIADRQTSMELVQENGGFKVKVRKAGSTPGAKPMEFNGFVLYPKTRRGMYLTYRSSCSLRHFGYVMRFLYNASSGYYRDVAINELEESGETGLWKQKQELRSEYKRGLFKCTPLWRGESLEKLIKQLRRIRAFEWTYANAPVKESIFQPVKSFVTTEKGALRFSVTTTNPGKIRKAIIDFITKYGPRKGRVIGDTDDGEEDVVSLTVKPEVFREYKFDEIVDEAFVNLAMPDESTIFTELLSVAQEYKKLIEG